MKKTYIFDTSVLISDPSAYYHFPDSEIVIPFTVLQELDKLKSQSGPTGRNARVAIRLLDEISDLGNINEGINIKENIVVHFDTTYRDLSQGKFKGLGESSYGDTHVLACALSHFQAKPDTILVSQDITLKIKAKSLGIQAMDYALENKTALDLYSGTTEFNSESLGNSLKQNGFIKLDDFDFSDLRKNEFISFTDDNGKVVSSGRRKGNSIILTKKHSPFGITPRNKEQEFAIELMNDKNIDLVTGVGKAGTGKSLMFLAAALELVLQKKDYNKLIIYRPIQSVGNDIGYLPGDMKEKLAPWFQAIMDNLEKLLSTSTKGGDWKKNLEMYQKKGQIEMEAISYIRGRSISDAIILVDEAQNLNIDNIKTILTRAGEGSKIVLTGDIEQIDNSDLDALNNGLTYVIEKFKGHDIFGHVTFTKGERSKLASLSADLL